jgi:Rrf2 family protein
MIFSKGTGYALRALIFLAEHRDEGPILAGRISDEAGIPKPTVSKILNHLATLRIVKSITGPKGGFWIEKDPKNIILMDIFKAFEPGRSMRECLLGHDACPGEKYCKLHKEWLDVQKHIDKFLMGTTVADISPMETGLQP